MARIYLAHITVYDPAIPGTKVLRFCNGRGFVTGTDAAKRPSGVSAHVAYTPRIKQPANMRRDIFGQGRTGGKSQIGYGELVLNNHDGGLDGFIDYGFDGREIEIIVGDVEPYQNPVFTTMMKGTMEQARINRREVSIRIRDRQELFDVPIQTNKYAGNNSLPNGLEGVEGDIKGQPKPLTFGKVFNVAPVQVNTSRLIFQVNDGAINTVDAVYDRGVSLTKGADYTSQSDMETTAPAAGNFRVWPAGGYFRLGSSPTGQVTADVTQGAAASDRTAAQVMKNVALLIGISSGDIDSGDVTALDTANSAVIGLFIDDEQTAIAAMDDVANSVGAWWGFDANGKLRMKQLTVPSGPALVTLTEAEIISIDRIETGDTGAGIPVWRTITNYKRFWVKQDSDLAGSVTDARRGELKNEWRTVVDSDSAVKTKHLLAEEVVFDTLLSVASDAATENTRRLTMYKTRRDRFEVRAALTPEMAANIDLGIVVQVEHNRFGLSAGKLFRVIGVQFDLRNNRVDLTLWG